MRHQLDEERAKFRKNEEAKLRKQIEDETALKLKDKDNETSELKESNKRLQEQILDTNRLLRQLQKQLEEKDLEVQKKLRVEEEKIRIEVKQKSDEENRSQKSELEKKIKDQENAIEDMKRKLQQGSQQSQGEILELSLETQLRERFPLDLIEEVKKGTEGGDILQTVKESNGAVAGIILWETKRTQNWSNSWLGKLREDAREAKASISILVTQVLPKEVETFGVVERVFVSLPKFALPLAVIVRGSLIRIASAKIATEHKDEKLEHLFKYLTSDNFRHRFEAQVESIVNLKDNLETEKRSLKRIWKQRDLQIERLMNNASNMYTELQGIAGQEILPSLKNFELPSGEEESIDG